MSAHVAPTAVGTMAVGIAGPLLFAHLGRSSADRLAPPLAVGVALGTVAAAFLTVRVDPFSRIVWYNAGLSGLYGLVFGLYGLTGYGILERLVLPAVFRLDATDRLG